MRHQIFIGIFKNIILHFLMIQQLTDAWFRYANLEDWATAYLLFRQN